MQAWQSTGPIEPQLHDQAVREGAPDVEGFRPLIRDQYIAPGDIGIWQAAIRDTADPLFTEITEAAAGDRTLSVDLLYTDQVGGQRTVSRFGLRPDDGGWFVAAARHWYLDGDAPR
ncbi:MAG: hypothetical protein QOG62_345 [Thermoleophilaceae bacterium]|nr:hypothetical protein [Thermoleophilaceae bacterium]